MNLIIDEGNTAFKLAIFDHENLILSKSFLPENRPEIHSWIGDNIRSIQNVIVSTVVKNGLDLSRYSFNIIRLHEHTKIPILNLYKTPDTLGRDRLANAVGAWYKNKNQNSLVIDVGTCIKYDLINSRGEYLGGAISPGISMRFEALSKFTANLPLLSKQNTDAKYGVDTNSSILKGVQEGIYHEINGFIQEYSEEFSRLTIFMTGGDAKFFDKPFICDIFANSDLTLFGLNKILTYNVQNT